MVAGAPRYRVFIHDDNDYNEKNYDDNYNKAIVAPLHLLSFVKTRPRPSWVDDQLARLPGPPLGVVEWYIFMIQYMGGPANFDN